MNESQSTELGVQTMQAGQRSAQRENETEERCSYPIKSYNEILHLEFVAVRRKPGNEQEFIIKLLKTKT